MLCALTRPCWFSGAPGLSPATWPDDCDLVQVTLISGLPPSPRWPARHTPRPPQVHARSITGQRGGRAGNVEADRCLAAVGRAVPDPACPAVLAEMTRRAARVPAPLCRRRGPGQHAAITMGACAFRRTLLLCRGPGHESPVTALALASPSRRRMVTATRRASGSAHSCFGPDPVRYMSVTGVALRRLLAGDDTR